MGWLRSLWKDLFRFLKSAKKKNYLLMASILINFLYHPNRSSLKRSHCTPPCAPRRSRTLSYPSPVTPAIFGLVVVCLSVVLRPFKAAMYFFSLIFCRSIRRLNRRHCIPLHAPPRSPLSFIAPQTAFVDCNLIVASFKLMAAI